MISRKILKFRKRVTTFIFQSWQKSLWRSGWDWRRALSPGFSLFGIDFFRAIRVNGFQADHALSHVLHYKFHTVLDVGAGSLRHSKMFSEAGKKVSAIDLGSSVYFSSIESGESQNIELILEDFRFYETIRKWDLVWASHILEHQSNAGEFLMKLVSHSSEGGIVCITVPIPHRTLWSGHLSMWTPGLLIYNLTLCGLDTTNSKVTFGNGEFSVILSPRKVVLPNNLVFDQGDLDKLKHLLPSWVYENSDPWNTLDFQSEN
jgi:SAM-dependent methyltransferase